MFQIKTFIAPPYLRLLRGDLTSDFQTVKTFNRSTVGADAVIMLCGKFKYFEQVSICRQVFYKDSLQLSEY